jgi:hypothetical protein
MGSDTLYMWGGKDNRWYQMVAGKRPYREMG